MSVKNVVLKCKEYKIVIGNVRYSLAVETKDTYNEFGWWGPTFNPDVDKIIEYNDELCLDNGIAILTNYGTRSYITTIKIDLELDGKIHVIDKYRIGDIIVPKIVKSFTYNKKTKLFNINGKTFALKDNVVILKGDGYTLETNRNKNDLYMIVGNNRRIRFDYRACGFILGRDRIVEYKNEEFKGFAISYRHHDFTEPKLELYEIDLIKGTISRCQSDNYNKDILGKLKMEEFAIDHMLNNTKVVSLSDKNYREKE